MVELDLLDANIGETDPGVLDHVFRVLRDTEQPVGDGKQVRPVFGEHRRSTIDPRCFSRLCRNGLRYLRPPVSGGPVPRTPPACLTKATVRDTL